jgi:hypothetical protein
VNTTDTNVLNINNESIVAPRVFYAYDSVGGVSILATPQTLDFGTIVINDIGYTELTGEVTIADTGLYTISYSVVTTSDGTTGDQRGTLNALIEEDTGSGFTTVSGSSTSAYLREQNAGVVKYSLSKTILFKYLHRILQYV